MRHFDREFCPPLVAPGGAASPTVSWTGPYARIHLGSAWSHDAWQSGDGVLAEFIPFVGEASSGGTIGGAQIGYNHQIGRWVLRAEPQFAESALLISTNYQPFWAAR